MKAAIERVRGEITNSSHLNAWFGFRELGYEIFFYDQGDVLSLDPDPEIVVAGGIASVWKALERLGHPAPLLPYIPEPLAPFAGRRLWTTTLGEVREAAERQAEPFFVKPPPGALKLFNGHVVRHFRDLIPMAGIPDELEVFCSEPVEFVAEYRGFVRRGALTGCMHYSGSFRIPPDFERIDAAVAAYTDAPAGYSLDVGVTRDGRTLLVEVNDGYSLGSYGLHPTFYARLLADRWAELAT